MKPIDLYAYYRALYRYFKLDEPYEIKPINSNTFKTLSELPQWEKLAGKRDCKNYVLANILVGNFIIRDFTDPAYLEWCRVNENLFYNYKTDLETLFTKGPTFNLLKLRFDYKISRETLIIIDALTKPSLIDTAWTVSKDNMVRTEGILLQKYRPIALVNMAFESKQQKYRNATIEVAAEAK